MSRNIRLVPKFNERDVDKFFLHFEKVATNLKWHKDMWSVLVQSVLVGKAQEVYSALSLGQSGDYDIVKQSVLKAYELVPEAYRQRFRNSQKLTNQTYVEFAQHKEQLFDRWCLAMKINHQFENLLF